MDAGPLRFTRASYNPHHVAPTELGVFLSRLGGRGANPRAIELPPRHRPPPSRRPGASIIAPRRKSAAPRITALPRSMTSRD